MAVKEFQKIVVLTMLYTPYLRKRIILIEFKHTRRHWNLREILPIVKEKHRLGR